MRLSVAVQAHPSRADAAARIAEALGGEVVLDPDPDGGRCAWRCYRACLASTPAWATHRLVVQDDVLLCDGLPAALERALAAVPDRVVALFVPGVPHCHRSAILDACAAGLAWARLENYVFCPAVALVWPSRLVPEILTFDDRHRQSGRWPELPEFGADDEIIGRFLQTWGEWAYATVPSLVEHEDIVESIGRDRRHGGGLDVGRVAACFVRDAGVDPASIDWAAGA